MSALQCVQADPNVSTTWTSSAFPLRTIMERLHQVPGTIEKSSRSSPYRRGSSLRGSVKNKQCALIIMWMSALQCVQADPNVSTTWTSSAFPLRTIMERLHQVPGTIEKSSRSSPYSRDSLLRWTLVYEYSISSQQIFCSCPLFLQYIHSIQQSLAHSTRPVRM